MCVEMGECVGCVCGEVDVCVCREVDVCACMHYIRRAPRMTFTCFPLSSLSPPLFPFPFTFSYLPFSSLPLSSLPFFHFHRVKLFIRLRKVVLPAFNSGKAGLPTTKSGIRKK